MTNALEIKNLQKVYDNKFQALKGIDLEVKQGDFFALLGPNGAGKSTTIGIICSLIKKSAGQVRVFGTCIDEDFATAKKYIGVVPQEFNFSNFEKPWQIVTNQAGYYGLPRALARERAEKYLRQLGLWDKRNEQARMLSGGMKRRLMIARALVHEPQLLILDEPTAGVDIELRRSMWEFLTRINKAGTTIILTTHYLEEAESLCRNIAIIDEGHLVETSMRKLLGKLNSEIFVFDIKDELAEVPVLGDFKVTRKDAHTLEVAVDKSRRINDLFQALDQQSIEVLSMRNKSNRLEELFVSLTGQADNGALEQSGAAA